MAAGVLPRWGDGQSDPALTDAALSVEAERFDPSVRDGLAAFFRKALDRDPRGGSTTPRRCSGPGASCSRLAERRTVTTPGGGEVALRDRAGPGRPRDARGDAGPEHPRHQRARPRGRDDRPPAPRPAGRRRPVHAGRRQEDARRDRRGARPPPEAVPEAAGRPGGRSRPATERPKTRRRSTSTPCDASCSARRRARSGRQGGQDPRAVPGPDGRRRPGDWPTPGRGRRRGWT